MTFDVGEMTARTYGVVYQPLKLNIGTYIIDCHLHHPRGLKERQTTCTHSCYFRSWLHSQLRRSVRMHLVVDFHGDILKFIGPICFRLVYLGGGADSIRESCDSYRDF